MSKHISDWIGLEKTASDQLNIQQARFMQATLDRTPSLQIGDVLPPLWHWLYFLDAAPESELGRDAHMKKGGFLPPVALPRRMWAGGRVQFHNPLVLGKAAERRSRIKSVTEKEGRTGKLCFVCVEHEISQDGDICVNEEHDIVFREDPDPNTPVVAPAPAPAKADFSRLVQPSSVMLFRYSALTFNGHRIHYDVDYARDVEGYDGLVFHGPLTATLLADLGVSQSGRVMKRFDYKGTAPLTGLAPFKVEGTIEGSGAHLWAKRADGALAMSAHAEFE